MEQLFASEEEAIKWVGLNIPWAVKPKKKTDSIKFINPFTSVHAHDVVVESLGKQLFKLQQKQHLIDLMNRETLEEAAERYVDDFALSVKSARKFGFIEGAKWQQEQDKKCYHPLPYRLAKSDFNFECTLCGKFI